MSSQSLTPTSSSSSARLLSIDALRGLTVAAMLLVNNPGDWGHVYAWLTHAKWHGCSPADFIFPFFLVIVGVSLHLALAPKLNQAAKASDLMKTVLWRGMRIFILGLVLNVIAMAFIEGREFRLMGILQRIGICFVVVGAIVIYMRNATWQWLLFLGILIIYSVLLVMGGTYEPHLNIVDKVDTQMLGKLAYFYDPVKGMAQDPEGIFATISSIASVLLGVRLAAWLQSRKLTYVLLFGLCAMCIAWLGSFYVPLNKHLWTSTFVLWTGGFAALCIGLMHRLIDVRGLPAIGISFGVNAIAAYAASWVLACILIGLKWDAAIYQTLLKPTLIGVVSEEMISLFFAILFTALFALLVWLMKRVGWRISI